MSFISHLFIYFPFIWALCSRTLLPPPRCVFFQSITSGPFVSPSFLSPPPSVVPISFPCHSRCQCGALSDTPRLFIHVWARARRRHNRLQSRRAAFGIPTPRGCVPFHQRKRCAKATMADEPETEFHAQNNQSKHLRGSTFVQTVALSLKHTDKSPEGKHAKQLKCSVSIPTRRSGKW